MAAACILVAATSATFDWEGQPVLVREGITTAREGHPILKGREHLFKPLEVTWELPAPKQDSPKVEPPPKAASGQRRGTQAPAQGKATA